MSEIKSVFQTLGMTPDDCKKYMESHNMLPQKVASVMTMRARGQENCDRVDGAINEAKEFIRKTASKLDAANLEHYLEFNSPPEQLNDEQRKVYGELLPVFMGQRFSMIMDEMGAALSKMCKKFTKEQIEAALAE